MASLKNNIISLMFVQIFNYIIPLLQLPYLSRILGVEFFGIVMFSLAFIQFINILTDYGFNLYLPQLIAGGENSPDRVSEFMSSVCIIKCFLSLIGGALFFTVILLKPEYAQHWHYFAIISLSIFANALFPIWAYQGLEILNVLSKIIIPIKIGALALIFLLTKSIDDLYWIAIIHVLQTVSVTVVAMGYLHRKGIRFSVGKCTIVMIKQLLSKSFHFFLSRVSVSVYTTGCSVFLGIFSTPVQVAYYSVAEQLYRAGQQVIVPFNQALYPYMMRTKNYVTFWKIFILAMIITACGAIVGFLFGDQIIVFIFGEAYRESVPLLYQFMMIIVVSTAAVLMGYPALSPLGKSSKANLSVIIAGVMQMFCLGVIAIFVTNILASLVIYCIMLCEILVLIYRIMIFYGANKVALITKETLSSVE